MESEAQTKILQLLDVIAVEVAANRNDTVELRQEVRLGFDRVDHRLENLETPVENLETEVQIVKADVRSFRGEFERRSLHSNASTNTSHQKTGSRSTVLRLSHRLA